MIDIHAEMAIINFVTDSFGVLSLKGQCQKFTQLNINFAATQPSHELQLSVTRSMARGAAGLL